MFKFASIAKLYARAIFDFSIEQESVDFWQEMLTFITKVVKNEQMKGFFFYALSPKELTDFFIAICGERLNQNGRNLIQIMAENGRLDIIPYVLEQFICLRLEKESTSIVEVVSSNSLSKEQVVKIGNAMERRFMKKVILNFKIDKSIIAGVIIRLNNIVIDAGVRNRLDKLAETLRFRGV